MSAISTRRHCLGLLGAGLAGLCLGRGAAADEDLRTAPQQFHRRGVDQQTLTIATTTGHYDFLVAIIADQGTSESALAIRRPISADEGILYTVPVVRVFGVSNKGVPFPTDLMFISRDGRIMQIQPLIMANDSRIFSSLMPVKAVFQVIAGTASRISARPGDFVLNSLFGRTL